jgi:hypothetical protein
MTGFWEREQRRKEIETKKERKKEIKHTHIASFSGVLRALLK